MTELHSNFTLLESENVKLELDYDGKKHSFSLMHRIIDDDGEPQGWKGWHIDADYVTIHYLSTTLQKYSEFYQEIQHLSSDLNAGQ